VAGRWRGGERLVEAPLLKNTLQGGERMVMVDNEGKSAKSLFQPVDYFPGATLMDVQLFTGRTHQIRVHATHEHHPIAGDPKYGDKTFNQALKKAGFKRMYLHAYRLAFKLANTSYNVTAPLDDEWAQLIQHLKS
ncbi:MAG: pseudouridine synthase, partial [Gammaproteobacteria bacterium]|nr:pseudouridine synthase [Gammaproteobacteria bacterium]